MSYLISRRDALQTAFSAMLLSANPRSLVELQGPERVAVIIGVNPYDLDSGFSPLRGAENDASQMEVDLAAAGYTPFLMTSASKIPARLPTKKAILDMIEEVCKRPNLATLLIYYSGHAIAAKNPKDPQGPPRAFLMPMGAKLSNPVDTGVSIDELARKLAGSKGNRGIPNRILLTDACRVAAADASSSFIDALKPYKDKWLFISSCGTGESALEVEAEPPSGVWQAPETLKPHGLFTRELFMAAYRPHIDENGNPGHGPFSLDDIRRYAVAATMQRAAEMGRKQTPQVFGFLSTASEPFLLPKPKGPRSNQIQPSQILQPRIGANSGRFYVYNDYGRLSVLPFRPYAWMFGDVEPLKQIDPAVVPQLMSLDIRSSVDPKDGKGTCIYWHVAWQAEANGKLVETLWSALGWVSAPDAPAWWAEDGDNRGTYYDLQTANDPRQKEARRFKALVFSARSPRAGTIIRATVGFLAVDSAGKKLTLGDSIGRPVEQKFTLNTTWPEQPFKVIFPETADLSRICSISFGVQRADQELQRGEKASDLFTADDLFKAPIDVFLDDIYFE